MLYLEIAGGVVTIKQPRERVQHILNQQRFGISGSIEMKYWAEMG